MNPPPIADAQALTCPDAARRCQVWREWELWVTLLLVGLIYGLRLTTLPVCGEESRWAGAAREMIASGDWIVPRQQGKVFAERPPLGSWLMAAVGLARGQVDAVAIRLPSALATTLLAVVIYCYGRLFLARRGALAAALCYATFGQVLQIGRLGESEAVFSFLLASALLVWHAGRVQHWPASLTWSAGYALAALAALVKGPQAPVYFIAVTAGLLAWRREWRAIFCWPHALGAALFAGIVALWQIPFWAATDRGAVVDVWLGLASDRFSLSGLAKHLASYPLETFGCLLPWSLLLVAFADPRFRRRLTGYGELLAFLCVALVVTYPSVWLSAGARGRYYMPLYPMLALLVGIVIQQATRPDAAAELRRGWRWFLGGVGLIAAVLAALVGVAGAWNLERLAPGRQPAWLALGLVCLWGAAAVVLLRGARSQTGPRPKLALVALAVVVGAFQTGLMISVKSHTVNDLAPDVAALRTQLPQPANLVSFGPIAHRFAYFYGDSIRELPWPTEDAQLPADLEYFCFERHRGDGKLLRYNGRGRTWGQTSASLPFPWEQVAWIPCDPSRRVDPRISVVVGRIVRPAHENPSEQPAAPLNPLTAAAPRAATHLISTQR